MKSLKRLFPLAAGIILGAKLIISYKENEKRQKEHRLILAFLKSNKDIEKLMELEEIKRSGVKFEKHPKSKKDSNRNKNWGAEVDNTITIPVCGNLIIPLDKNMQLLYLAHEFGHLNNKHSFKHYRPCKHTLTSCLLVEVEADLYAAGLLKKIGVELNRDLWLRNFAIVRGQCKSCLKVIKAGKCPQGEMKKILKYLEEYLNLMREALISKNTNYQEKK